VRFVKAATESLHNPLQLYLAVGVLFILINYLLSKLAVWVEHWLSRAPRVAAPPRGATRAPGTPALANTGTAGG
jgi:glutamate transport system permease protein